MPHSLTACTTWKQPLAPSDQKGQTTMTTIQGYNSLVGAIQSSQTQQTSLLCSFQLQYVYWASELEYVLSLPLLAMFGQHFPLSCNLY